MKIMARILMWLTLWCDLCLIQGVMFTGNYGKAKIAAVISVGNFSVDSHSHGGAVFIVFISIWTAVLAICGLLAFWKAELQKNEAA
jgi:hypothetical protein